jgi:uncharacterized membrane protein
VPVACYGVVLLGAAVAYTILVTALVTKHGKDSPLAKAVGRDGKGKVSMLIYAVAVPLAFVNVAIACALYASVALMWLVPDLRIERVLDHDQAH